MKKLAAAALLFAMTALSSCLPTATAEDGSTGYPASSMLLTLGIMAVFFIAMYFMTIKPQKKQEKEKQEMLASMAVGDTVLTTAGFYGVVIDITEDTIIVEFGNNKNCRIPMQKAAIVQLEHPEGYVAPAPAEETKKEEKKKDEKK